MEVDINFNFLNKEEKMECVHLDLWVVPVSHAKLPICKKVGKSYGRSYYSPTIFQVQEYCKKKEHARCPFFLRDDEDGSIESLIPTKNQPLPQKRKIEG